MENLINGSPIVVVTPVELQAMINEAVKAVIPQLADFRRKNEALESDALTLDDAVQFLSLQGLPTTISSIYAQVHRGAIPYKKVGRRVIFSKRELLGWIDSRTTQHEDKQAEAALRIAKSTIRK